MSEENEITLGFRFDAADEDVTVTVTGYKNPMIGLAALKTAGSEESLEAILAQMKEQQE
ncbi:hypothetical protein SEA_MINECRAFTSTEVE_63 [Gordonia phage MinecraftSteve]|uniref:Uncharacterized protein n=2 Tax=Soupsvirus TaxID=1982562 RepID=A0A160DG82_9CAUD|nr:hypothetical protein BEN61_gp050 [Gordonia phage Rosalind]YP_009269361.1 hypothetical protein BEN59_gp048 [Gordonia phage Soups]YP_009624578.1 hypothetical protein FDJ48_gp047 [Gordonia phage Waits]QFP95127.1 hypothetical protein SEA_MINECRAFTSTEVE_63 [Gordonia phage MinecraftSteve]WIC40156.1 hypothetical protein SEA_BATTLESHIP_65 [Gordonia phage Battleship]ANA86998.1 hypothetical protein PBI_SOUPS_63 [Gordonia phage Soups]ANA87094.1 hypothetical protein PBI_ROSALIND_61 [Gordonia phage Ros